MGIIPIRDTNDKAGRDRLKLLRFMKENPLHQGLVLMALYDYAGILERAENEEIEKLLGLGLTNLAPVEAWREAARKATALVEEIVEMPVDGMHGEIH